MASNPFHLLWTESSSLLQLEARAVGLHPLSDEESEEEEVMVSGRPSRTHQHLDGAGSGTLDQEG